MKVNKSAVRIMLDNMTNDERDQLVTRLIENVERLNERLEELESERRAFQDGNKY